MYLIVFSCTWCFIDSGKHGSITDCWACINYIKTEDHLICSLQNQLNMVFNCTETFWAIGAYPCGFSLTLSKCTGFDNCFQESNHFDIKLIFNAILARDINL